MPSHPIRTLRIATRTARLSLLLAALLWASTAHAQQGTWGAGFDHSTTAPAAQNDFTLPFQGTGYQGPQPPYEWGAPMYGGRFHAIHMAVIPKGPHQGRLLVWDIYPVILRPNSTLEPQGRWWTCQSWSIVDPDTGQLWNYLLPLQPVVGTGPFDQNTIEIADLFCTGHAWSQEGDLVVAGGITADLDGTTTPPTPVALRSAKFLFLFDPKAASQPFPGQPVGSSLYPAPHVGRWLQYDNGLLVDRFYPTVTLSQKITTRNNLNNEIVLISGGSDPLNTSPPSDPRNHYECYVVRRSNDPAGFLSPDPDPTPQTVLPGPSTPGVTQGLEWFDEYPRWHLLSTGTTFLSGPVPLSSQVDLRTATPRAWDVSTGRAGYAFPYRGDGASLFFARLNAGALLDVVVRLGGRQGDIATDTAEYCLAGVAGASWAPLPDPGGTGTAIPGGPRTHVNAAVLPDASILVIGGSGSVPVSGPPRPAVRTTALYRQSTGWQTQPDTPTRRGYHTTMVVLPDGRVLVGGGEGRDPVADRDYDIFSPHYLQGSPLRPTIVSVTDSTGAALPTDPVDGTILLDRSLAQTLTLTCGNIPDLDALDKIVLMAPGSITHHSDMTARYVELPSGTIPNENAKRLFTLPNGNMLPNGYYMLFALNTGGTPSVASWIKVF